jgi:hypothetical protein
MIKDIQTLLKIHKKGLLVNLKWHWSNEILSTLAYHMYETVELKLYSGELHNNKLFSNLPVTNYLPKCICLTLNIYD